MYLFLINMEVCIMDATISHEHGSTHLTWMHPCSMYSGCIHPVQWMHPYSNMDASIQLHGCIHIVTWMHPYCNMDASIQLHGCIHIVTWMHPYSNMDASIHTTWMHPYMLHGCIQIYRPHELIYITK